MYIYIYISSVCSPFSDGIGLPLHIIPSPGVLMKSIGAQILCPNALPGVNHMPVMQHQIVLNTIFWSNLN